MISKSSVEEFLLRTEGRNIVIDSRKVSAGDVFVGLKGEKVDGNDFVEEALSKGASLVFSNKAFDDRRVLRVDDTNEILIEAARSILSKCKLNSRIGITGSNGKTTTKEISSFLLSKLGRVFKTAGNLNTEIGLPLSLLKSRRELFSAQYGVFEFGTSSKGDIEKLVGIVQPDTAVLLNVGSAHVGNFRDFDELLQEKLSIFKSERLSRAVLWGCDERLREFSKGLPVETLLFGEEGTDFSIVDFAYDKSDTMLHFFCDGDRFARLRGIWSYGQLLDLGAAYLVARLAGLEEPSVFLNDYKLPFSDRFTVNMLKGITVISDFYNSSLESWESAMLSIEKLEGSRKIAVAGSILEQGREEKRTHERLGELLSKFDETVLFTRDMAINAASKNVKPALVSDSEEEIAAWLHRNVRSGDLVFFKASRAIALEGVYKSFMELVGSA
ncbi:MAG: UDP-N-acetylmuramoyl-tripeptide--D-alanyl-D-alanine ligase [Kosmotogaceae bacterium]|nr:UDP-N-acetylmuramoyl-tripeptide--D-alanyl-D-alanine ligase [Kosmotogaceae bacterium]